MGVDWDLFFSPIIEWCFIKFSGAFFFLTGWENFVVGYWCWFLILILLRLTAFLPEQRYKSKLLLMALVLCLLSVNIGRGSQENPSLNQFNPMNHDGSRMNNFQKDQHSQIFSELFTLDEMGRVDQLQFDYELRESDATTKIIYNQGADID